MSGEVIQRVKAVAEGEPSGPRWLGSNGQPMQTIQGLGGRIPNGQVGAMQQQRSIFEGGNGVGAQVNQVRMLGAAAVAPPRPPMALAPKPPVVTRNAYVGRNLGQASSTSPLTAIAVLAGVVVVAAGIFILTD